MKKIIVIGAGIAGLAASIRLARAGNRVHVFEANESAGGNIREIRKDGFRFDGGPSILTRPEYISELFLLCNKRTEDYIRFLPIEPLFRYFFPDGTTIDSYSDKKKFAAELEKKSAGSYSEVEALLEDSREIFRLTDEVFLQRSLHELKNYFNWPTLRGILRFNRVHAFRSMHRYNRKKFSDPRLIRLFNRYASFNGSDPYAAPATLNVITHFAVNEGSWLPGGGMISLARALEKIARESGVEFTLQAPVSRILHDGKKISGVEVGGSHIPADVVVSNTDIHYTYKTLLPEIRMPAIVEKQPRSSSVIVFYWGIKKIFDEVELHNTFFGSDDKEEFDAVFSGQSISDDPSVYVYNSSRVISGDAPPGMSNWFVMVTAPYDAGQDWDAITAAVRKNVLKKLSAVLNQDIEPLIISETMLNPPGIEKRTHAWQGSVYGNSSNGMLSAFLRHSNFSSRLKGLYFCGGSVHPGAGIPLCLLSAKIMSDLISRREK